MKTQQSPGIQRGGVIGIIESDHEIKYWKNGNGMVLSANQKI
jgi:hypothetical protein